MKIYRRIVFTGSLLVSVALYAVLYTFASVILLLPGADAAHTSLPKPLRIMLYNGPMPESRPPEARGAVSLASRPGSVEDLLKEETRELPLAAPVAPPATPPPPLAEALAREHELTRDDVLLGGIEAQIVAIPEQSARANIEVARRLVPDNDQRLIAKDEMPALSDGSGLPATFALPSSAAPAVAAPSPAPEAPWPEAPAMSLLDPSPDRPSVAVPGLEDETVLGRKTLIDEVRSGTPFGAMEGMVRLEATTYVDPASRDGYFRLRIIPRDDAKIPTLPRDVTFVVDASTSIVQRKLDLTVRGLDGCLAMLRPEDRFNIIIFRDLPKSFRPAPVPAEPATIAEARKFIEGLKSSGSTDVYGAVEPVLAEPPRAGGPGLVMVITDGRPTTGNLEGRELIRGLSEQNKAGNTVYTFGGGNTVNRYLMDLLAYRNRGESRVAERIEDVDDELPKFFRRVQDALLVDLQADYGQVDESSVFPQALPDFYRGRVVTVFGRYSPGKDKDFVLRLQGRAGPEQKEIVLKADLAGAAQGGREVAEGWAFQKSYHLIGEITKAGETPELMGEIQRLSNEFGVKTSYSP